MTSTLESRLAALNKRIHKACEQSQRTNNSVNLLAVSKTRDINTIFSAYNMGLRRFGENYLSEAEQKIPNLPEDIEWHFIGPVQSNKTARIAELFDWVETIDREKIARRLDKQRPDHLPSLQCLIQINISQDENKAGIDPGQLEPLAKAIIALPRLELRGLMTIPKALQSEPELQNDFAKMAGLLRQLQSFCPGADTLSMGMSADLEPAIAAGSTEIRIGTDLFGPRQNRANPNQPG